MGYGWLKTNTAGTGAYALLSWKPNESYVLEANADYWRAKPAMKRVFVRHITASASQRLLLVKGDVDFDRTTSPADIATVSEKDGLRPAENLIGRRNGQIR